jgi:hypothetical protein
MSGAVRGSIQVAVHSPNLNENKSEAVRCNEVSTSSTYELCGLPYIIAVLVAIDFITLDVDKVKKSFFIFRQI